VGFTTHKTADQKGLACSSFDDIARYIRDELSDATILIKGSRSAEMKRVISALEVLTDESCNNVEGQG